MSTKKIYDGNISSSEDISLPVRPPKQEDLKSDEEFLTASECTLPHSRSSSYNTASECEHRYSPWWEYDKKDVRENIIKEKMVLGVGLPELPHAKSVLQPSPEIPPGKFVREVTETTHLKVQHSHTMGVASFVLTSEIAGENDVMCNSGEEAATAIKEHTKEAVIVNVQLDKEIDEDELKKRINECGDWIQLKILEINPELTTLGNNLTEALELQRAHDEVLRQLQNKQSPVEELLRQADQLISTQKPRAEVYAAMAESLGRAWKDINAHLELRKQILDLNVQYHNKAQEFFDKVDALEDACSDSVVPIEVESIKSYLTNIHDLRRSLLESLMGALQAGNSILGKLRELGAEGTLDSRPDRLRCSVNRAISQVQGWMDELHARRQVLEQIFTGRKTQLEQCLALALLASDLHDVEDSLKDGRELLKITDQLGDSASSAELLYHEHKKLLPEAKQLQERALKITKATEQLVASGCFAGEKATQQAYAILSDTSEYLGEIENRSSLLERVIAFFRSAQTALTKLDQLEVQITTAELPLTSPQLAHLHGQCAKTIEEITSAPILEGHAILDIAGRGRPGTEGVRRMVEELENRKIFLDGLCTAHREEKLRINQALNAFLEQQNELYSWLISAAEAFLQGHQDMGSDLPMAKDFWDLHNKLLIDLQGKGNEINALLLTLPPVLEYLEENQRRDVDSKVEELHELWLKLKNILETRLDLSAIYVKFHTEADYVNREIDKLEEELRRSPADVDESTINRLEEKWESLVPLYQSAKNTGLTFINEANKVSEPHLDTKRACVCVESVLEKLSGRQLLVTRSWQSFQTNVVEKRELQVQLEINMVESTKTINWVSKLDTQLYPVIATNATNPTEIASYLEQKLEKAYPEIKRAQAEVQQRIKAMESLIVKAVVTDNQSLNVKNKLIELNQKLIEITMDYQILLQMLTAFFNNVKELDKTIENLNSQFDKMSLPNEVSKIDLLIREHDASKQAILEMFKFIQNDRENLISRINKQEPKSAADHDIQKLQQILEIRKNRWEEDWQRRRQFLDAHKQICHFDSDLIEINETIDELTKQLADVKGQYGESLPAAQATAQAFAYFEKTVEILGQRIEKFIDAAEKLIADGHVQSPHIEFQVKKLQDRWNALNKQVQDNKRLINLSIEYFKIVEEALEWFKLGSHILVNIARKSTTVKKPEEAQQLLNEIDEFLKPGEAKQAERIQVISSLAQDLYGPQLSSKSSQVVIDNREMLESFAAISQELQSLALNLQLAEEERERMKIQQQEADEKLAAAKAEAQAAYAAAVAAEEAKREAEVKRLEAEEQARRTAELEAKRIAEAERLAKEEAKRIAEEEAKRIAEEEAKRIAEAKAKKLKEEEDRKRAEEEAKVIALAELEAKRIAEAKAEIKVGAELEPKTIETVEDNITREVITKTIEVVKMTHVQNELPVASEIIEDTPKMEPPLFITPLSDAVLQEGTKFTFMCQVTGVPTPIVVWYKDGIAIENNPDYQTSFNQGLCTLAIEETFTEDSARYTCKASNAAGSTETIASLFVKENQPEEQLIPPKFVKPLEPALTKQGQAFQFECKVEGNPLPTVQWFKNGDCIDNSSDYAITYNNGDAILRFNDVQLGDVADYTCKASNQVGMAQTTANLCVEPSEPTEKPTFLIPLSNVMARAGQKIKLECEVSGLPTPSLTWSHNGKPVKETRELKFQSDAKRATLVISEAFPKDAGAYVVTAANKVGEATSACNVTVKGRLPTETSDSELASDMEPIKPSIQVPLKDLSVFDGKCVRLDCVIVGQPEPEVIWYHNEKPVKESPDFQLLFQGDRCSLIIKEAFTEDSGEYKVVALNSAGEASSKCTLTVTPLSDTDTSSKPPQEDAKPIGFPPKFNKLLSDVLVSEGDKVIFEATVSGEPRPEIQWLLNNNEVTSNDHVQITHSDEGTVTLEIEKVTPQDKGVYTVKAKNDNGDAKCFAQLIVKSFKPVEVQKEYEEVKAAPTFKEIFSDRTAFEETATKFECIVTGKPTPKVKWFFNEEPVTGKDLLISTSGERQVLSIPIIKKEHAGKLTCVAENEAGKATCFAILTVQPASLVEPLVEHADDITSYSSKREVFMQSSTSSTSTVVTNSTGVEPKVEVHGHISQDSKSFKQINQEAPQIIESHEVEEFHKVDKEPSTVQDKLITSVNVTEEPKVQKTVTIVREQSPFARVLKSRPPKFTSPVVGKIVDQGVDVILEGILDGSPTPTVTWTKNGAEISTGENLTITYEHNRAQIEIKNVTTNEAGRYTCTAVNEAGTAVSTSDLVVRKTVFPPVFGKRLQAQVVKKGDRIHMEIEVTGTPVPTVMWFKDDKPIREVLKDNYKLNVQGNSHTLIIGTADFNHTGKYMVRATNDGGEAQSIADIAVFEPTPDTMVEVVKTVVFEDVHKHETLAQAAEQSKMTHTMPNSQPTTIEITTPKPTLTPIISTEPTPFMQSSETQISKSVSSNAEFSTVTETKITQESKSVKMESSTANFSPLIEKQHVTETKVETSSMPQIHSIQPTDLTSTTEEGIQTESISKQSSLNFFVQKMKESEEPPKPKELPKGIPLQSEIYTKFEDTSFKTEIPTPIKQPIFEQKMSSKETEIVTLPEYQPPVMAIQSSFQETSKLPLKEQKSQFHEEKHYQQFSSSQYSFSSTPTILKPEPPPEICYAPRQEYGEQKLNEDKFTEIKPVKPIQSYLKPEASHVRPVSPKPSAEGIQMEKLWTPHKEPDINRPTSAPLEKPIRPISAQSEPSAEALAMEKNWAHKFSESYTEPSWPPASTAETTKKSWSAQTTLEKKWAPVQRKVEFTKVTKTMIEPQPLPVLHYVARVTDLHETEFPQTITSEIHKESLIEERSVKASEIIKSWPPVQREETIPAYKPVMPSIHSLSIRPASVQDITDEVYLEPGPPPEIGYAQPPSHIESVERSYRKEVSKTSAPIVHTIIPPPLPPKQEKPQAPPVPNRPVKPVNLKKTTPIDSKPFEKFPNLEPFPFKPDPEKPKHIKPAPPPTPSKFIKGRFTDSDYESDFESMKIPPKWKPCSSDTEELNFRSVRVPKFTNVGRSKSIEPEPLPPFKFVKQVSVPFKSTTSYESKHQTTEYAKRDYYSTPLKPGTPPEYVEIKVKAEPEKFKSKAAVDGYMADTDEPFTLRKKSSKTESEYYSSSFKSFESSRQKNIFESQSVPKPVPPKVYRKHVASSAASKKELVSTPIITSISTTREKVTRHDDRDSSLEPFPYKPDPPTAKRPRGPPPPSPSKFVKGEFRESDYESDYEGKLHSVWGSESDRCYKPVRPVLTPSGRQSQASGRTPTPPTEFDQPPHFSGPPRPKFEPIEKPSTVNKISEVISEKKTKTQFVHKPKPVTAKATSPMDIIIATPAVPKKQIILEPGSPPEIAYAPGPKTTQYYRSTTSAPYQNAIQTETSNLMHFNESTEHSHRTVSLQQTHKVITFGQQKKEEKVLEHSRQIKQPPPPTPTKFVKGEFKESDYDSEMGSTKIKSAWISKQSDSDIPNYRKVVPPQVKSQIHTISQKERILSPMEFEAPSSVITKSTVSSDTYKKVGGMKKSFEESKSAEIVLKPGSPPKYDYAPEKVLKTTATKAASKHMEDMTHTFKSKAQQFVSDIMTDVNKKPTEKAIVKRNEGDAQVYREESRAAQYGTKHVDPDTGLIYFKYDFGYEFGVILPGQSKGGEIPMPKKTIIEPPKRTKDIDVPVHHESTQQKYTSYPSFRPTKIVAPTKTVKWEPTSESEMSEYESDGKKKQFLNSPRWEPSSTSPYSLSPSLPSTSPAFNIAGPRSVETPISTPTTPVSIGQNSTIAKGPPVFITPLRDIAVVSGQTARFECIVQSDLAPTILWSKNGRIIENSNDHQIHFRNGVCRLTIPQTFPEDAGTYTCTATNQIGAVGTTATLQVPGERRSQYIK